MNRRSSVSVHLFSCLAVLGLAACPEAAEPTEAAPIQGEVETIQQVAEDLATRLVYVPAYQYAVDKNGRTSLSVTLTVHNTSLEKIRIDAVDYFNADGVLVDMLLTTPRDLGALETIEFARVDGALDGGSGANFLVAWTGSPGSQPPLAEALMVGHQGSGRLTFTSRGVPVQRPIPARPTGTRPNP